MICICIFIINILWNNLIGGHNVEPSLNDGIERAEYGCVFR